jgi:CheY-like chemotaxis protein
MTQLVLHTDLDAEQRDYISTVRDSAESLLVIVNDILDFSKIEAGKMELSHEPFCLHECVTGALAVFTWKAREKSLSLSCEIAPEVPRMLAGDVDRLRQILINLLGNAMKFTERGEVSLDVSLDRGPGVTLHFVVRDTGIGIARETQERIFQSFAQADGASRRQGGTGLGLAICSKLVELMQGRIWVESAPGSGSAFHFTASFDRCQDQSPQPPEKQPAEPAAAPSAAPLRILLAEDNVVNQKLAQHAIGKMGHSLLVAGNGLRAVEAAAAQSFDLILMDLQMPEMDGFQAATRIRQAEFPFGRHTPIIAMTAHAMQDDRELCQFSVERPSRLGRPLGRPHSWGHASSAPPRQIDRFPLHNFPVTTLGEACPHLPGTTSIWSAGSAAGTRVPSNPSSRRTMLHPCAIAVAL